MCGLDQVQTVATLDIDNYSKRNCNFNQCCMFHKILFFLFLEPGHYSNSVLFASLFVFYKLLFKLLNVD